MKKTITQTTVEQYSAKAGKYDIVLKSTNGGELTGTVSKDSNWNSECEIFFLSAVDVDGLKQFFKELP